ALIVSTLDTLCTSIIRLSSPRVISDRLFIPDFPYYIVCLICQCVTPKIVLNCPESSIIKLNSVLILVWLNWFIVSK
nr:hypothetical protein [Nostoc sp. DedSLP05]MDZ8101208.1 hypothetical protein [Nostoc sp. DedSLP01]